MHKKAHTLEETPLSAYGVCCSAKETCPLSYESEQFTELSKLLQTSEGSSALKLRTASLTRYFQCSTAACAVCRQPVLTSPGSALSANIDARRLERVLRLRNQLLGLEILPVR